MAQIAALFTAVIDLLKEILGKIQAPSGEVSAILLTVIVVGMIGLLFWMIPRPPGPPKEPPLVVGAYRKKHDELEDDLQEKIDSMKEEEISELKKTIDKLAEINSEEVKNPDFSLSEKLYFNINGVVNAGLILSISMLLWQYLTLEKYLQEKMGNFTGTRQQKSAFAEGASKIIDAANGEVAKMMFVLLLALVVSMIFVGLAYEPKGRSSGIINKAFTVSLVVSVVTFVIFVALRANLLS